MARDVTTLSAEHHRLWRESPANPKVFIVVHAKFSRDSTLFIADVGIGESSTRVFMQAVDIDLERLRKFSASLQHYFPKDDCHRSFPAKAAKLPSHVAAGQIQHYFEEVLRIPGISIFHPFIELFGIDPTRLQPNPLFV
jgi:hypothetical protein